LEIVLNRRVNGEKFELEPDGSCLYVPIVKREFTAKLFNWAVVQVNHEWLHLLLLSEIGQHAMVGLDSLPYEDMAWGAIPSRPYRPQRKLTQSSEVLVLADDDWWKPKRCDPNICYNSCCSGED